MDNPQETNENSLTIENNINDLKWFGGFFDGEGSFSFSQRPQITLVNTNPIAISRSAMILKKYNIDFYISERSKPSKSSKKKRWDISIKNKYIEDTCHLLSKYIYGKINQNDFIINNIGYKKENIDILNHHMQYLNQTNNIIILDDNILKEKLGFEFEKNHLNHIDDNSKIDKTDFCDLYYLSGIIDAEGTIGMNQRQRNNANTDRFTPVISLVNTNKEIITKCYSTLLNLGIGCHISTRDNMQRNRVRWDLLISGVKRCRDLSEKLKDKLIVKKQQNELLNLYCYHRLDNPKSINEMGYEYKMAIQKLNSES